MAQRIAWIAMTFLALLMAAYATGVLVTPMLRSPFLQQLFIDKPTAISIHIGGSLIAIAVGTFQLNQRLRSHFISAHRWAGRVYVIAVVVGGTSGFMLALTSLGGLVTHFGFGLLAACWIGSTLIAYWHIRRGDITAHRAWMIRSYALTLAAVTLRLYLGLFQAAGIDFASAYQVVSWLCWVLNILIVEWVLLARTPGRLTST